MKVYQLLPAPALTTTWMRNLIEPACTAARLTNPRGIEVRPIGSARGISPGDKIWNSSGRITISTRAFFWTRRDLVTVYVHENVHALLDEVAPDLMHGHDAAFFALQLALLQRLDAANYLAAERFSKWVDSASLYDLQDPPPCWKKAAPEIWRPRAIEWAMAQAAELAPGDMDALALAREIDARYWVRADAWAVEPAAQAAAKHAAERRAALQAAQLAQAQHQAWQRGWLALVGIGGLVAAIVLAILQLARS